MVKIRYVAAMLAAGGGLATASSAGAVTQTLNIAGDGPDTDIYLAGSPTAQFDYGLNDSSVLGTKSSLAPDAQTSLLGSLSATPIPTDLDTYSNSSVVTGFNSNGNGYSASSSLEPYLDLEFTANGAQYAGTATFDSNAVLESISYSEVSAAPEPAAWALLIAGVAGAGAALRRRRQDQALAPQRA